MAYATEIRTSDRSDSLRSRIANFFAQLAERREQYLVFRATLHELNNLSDRELADLGLARANIRSIAWESTYGKK